MATNMLFQIKSRKRVKELGEILTAKREVESITDLIKDLSEKIDSRFLEPSCGTGNFLCEILNRRLERLKNTFKKKLYFEFHLLKSVASLYGIDIDNSNVKETKKRMNDIIKSYKKNCENKIIIDIAKKITDSNIILGNAINEESNLLTINDSIVFTEFTTPKIFYFKKAFYKYSELKREVRRPFKESKILFYTNLYDD